MTLKNLLNTQDWSGELLLILSEQYHCVTNKELKCLEKDKFAFIM